MSKIRIFKSVFLAGAISVLLSSCFGSTGTAAKNAKSGAEPDWLTGQPAAYPQSAYLTGSGSGADKRSAELDAIGELVSIFGQSINTATTASHRMELAQSAGVVASSDNSSLDQTIFRDVSQNDVIAIEIPEFYESKSENKWHALAVMNRSKGTQIYSSMIEKNQAEIASIIKEIQADSDPNTMINFSRLDFCEEVAKVNEGYLKRLTIINPTAAKKYASVYTPVQIHKMRADMAAKIPICVKVSADSDGRIAKSFQETMTAEGFNTSLGSNERYVIDCKVHFTQSESANGKTFFCEYAAECALIDTFSGDTLVPLSITGREGSTSSQNAEIRAKQKISSKVKTEFAASFQKYLGDFSAF